MAGAAAETGEPIPFQHSRHAAFKLECALCHPGAEKKARAGLPKVGTCMTCHQAAGQDHPAIRRLAALDRNAALPIEPLPYRIPDFVFFSHARHVAAKVACANCHGDVWRHDLAKPAVEARMSGCVNCHKASGARLDCTLCHELSQ